MKQSIQSLKVLSACSLHQSSSNLDGSVEV
jgi:hypothetical protein